MAKIRWRYRPLTTMQKIQQIAGDPTWGFAYRFINWQYENNDYSEEQLKHLKSLFSDLDIEIVDED